MRYRDRVQLLAVGLAVAAALALLGGIATATTAPRTEASHAGKTVKPDFAFYAGKTVTYITGGSPGGGNDVTALTLAPLMASYLHCTINVEDLPAGASTVAQEATAAAAPNGLTFGQGSAAVDIEDEAVNQPAVNFSLKTQEWIGSLNAESDVLVATPSSGIRTLSQLLKTHGARIAALSPVIADTVLNTVYKLHDTVVTGFANSQAQLEGLTENDGEWGSTATQDAAPYIAAGKLIGLAVMTPYPKGAPDYSTIAKIPSFWTYVAKHPPTGKANATALKTLDTFNSAAFDDVFAPVGTPPQYVAALTAALRSAVKQADSKLIALGVPNFYKTPQSVVSSINEMVKLEADAAPYLGVSS